MIKRFLLAAAAVSLTACGGGGGGTSSGPTGPVAVATDTTRLRGAALVMEAGTLERALIAGEYNASNVSGSIRFTHNRGIDITDANGLDGAGNLTNGTVTLAALSKPSSVQWAFPYVRTVDMAGNPQWGVGVYGARPLAKYVATSGSANYAGTATLFDMGAATPNSQANGTSNLSVDFGAQSATLDIRTTGGAIAGVDHISFPDLSMRGGSDLGRNSTLFSTNGQAFLGGSPATALGTIARTNARAHFYGDVSAEGVPDEVGGAVLIEGSSGTISGVFVAD